jgi:hypothetical protein
MMKNFNIHHLAFIISLPISSLPFRDAPVRYSLVLQQAIAYSDRATLFPSTPR